MERQATVERVVVEMMAADAVSVHHQLSLGTAMAAQRPDASSA